MNCWLKQLLRNCWSPYDIEESSVPDPPSPLSFSLLFFSTVVITATYCSENLPHHTSYTLKHLSNISLTFIKYINIRNMFLVINYAILLLTLKYKHNTVYQQIIYNITFWECLFFVLFFANTIQKGQNKST